MSARVLGVSKSLLEINVSRRKAVAGDILSLFCERMVACIMLLYNKHWSGLLASRRTGQSFDSGSDIVMVQERLEYDCRVVFASMSLHGSHPR